MTFPPRQITGFSILALIALCTGCASTPKPVKCNADLEPINQPPPLGNLAPTVKAPQSLVSEPRTQTSKVNTGDQ
jgi:hypothetical protein